MIKKSHTYLFGENYIFLTILFFSLFSSSYVFFVSPFEFYFHYIFVILFMPFFVIKIGVPKFILSIFGLLLLVGISHIILGNNNHFNFLKIYCGLFIMILFFYYLLHYVVFDVKYIFYWYCKFCYLLCLIAFVQLISFSINFEPGYNYSWLLNKWGVVKGGLIGIRLNSIISEPTYLASILSPSLYISLNNIVNRKNLILNKYQSILVIFVVILTTSTIGYLGLLLSLLLVTNTIKLRYIIFGFFLTLLSFNLAYKFVDDFKTRVESAKGLWFDNNFHISNTNSSSFVLFNNLHVAKENLLQHPIFGTGLGSHETAYKKYTLTNSIIKYDFEFNVKDGNSLFVRLCTETGLFGILFILYLILNGFIYNLKIYNDDMMYHKIISQALFVLIILVLIRQGNYMLNGLPLLFLMYFFNFTQYQEKLNNIETEH